MCKHPSGMKTTYHFFPAAAAAAVVVAFVVVTVVAVAVVVVVFHLCRHIATLLYFVRVHDRISKSLCGMVSFTQNP